MDGPSRLRIARPASRSPYTDVPADGSGTATPYFTTTLGNPYEASYTPDGKSIVFRVDTRTTKRDVVLAPVDSPQVTRPLLTSPFDEHMIAVSPMGDGSHT